MTRVVSALKAPLAGLIGLTLLSACTEDRAPLGPAETTACMQLPLFDAKTGAAVTGAEDLAVDPSTGTLYISAFDRFALEDALERNQPVLPRGGLYTVDLDTVLSAEGPVTVDEQLSPFFARGDFRPHGIDLYTGPFGRRVLAVIVHRYHRDGVGEGLTWTRSTDLETYTITEDGLAPLGSAAHPGLCQANDVAAVSPRHFLVTRDRGACGSWMWAEDVLGLRRASVVHVELSDGGRLERPPVPVAGGIGFANGITVDREARRAIVAATREEALLVYDLDTLLSSNAGRPVGRIVLPGGPDNLIMADGQTLLAGVHPSLLRMGFYRNRWFETETAPARLMRVDMSDASTGLVYDDMVGADFPAVTAGIEYADHIIMGSVTAPGLMVCSLNAPDVTP